MPEGEKKLLKLRKAADMYSIPVTTLRDACILGKVQGVMIGARWYVEPKEMDRLAKEGYRNVGRG